MSVQFSECDLVDGKIILTGKYLLSPELNLWLSLSQIDEDNDQPVCYPDSCLGYHFIDGGITNQKLALFGLFCEAAMAGKPLVLPNIYVLNQNSNAMELRPFREVFDEQKILAFGKKFGICISCEDPRDLGGNGWNFFVSGAGFKRNVVFQKDSEIATEFAQEFFLELCALTTTSLTLGGLLRRIFYDYKVDAVLQLRIEKDWKEYVKNFLFEKYKDTEDLTVSTEEILTKVKNTLPQVKNVFIICDEPGLQISKKALKHLASSQFGIEFIFKSDILAPFELKKFDPLDMSLLDFDIACAAEIFIGNTRSTFSCMVPLQNSCSNYKNKKKYYIYNHHSNFLQLRKDCGIYDNPEMAISGIML